MGPIDPTNRPLTKEELETADYVARRRAEQAKRDAAADAALDVPRVSLGSLAQDSRLARELARFNSDPEYAARAAALRAAAEETDREEIQRIRRRNRFNAYASNRPSIYSTASYDDLDPANRDEAKIRNWWKSGAKTLMVAGEPGRGKTHGAYAVCNEVAAADRDGLGLGQSVRAYAATEIRDMLIPLKPHEARDDVLSRDRAAAERALYEVDLLLIDDLTAAKVTDWFREAMHKVIDQRIANERRTIVTLNAPAAAPGKKGTSEHSQQVVDHMVATLGAPIVSRLKDQAVWVWLDGADRRTRAIIPNPFLEG